MSARTLYGGIGVACLLLWACTPGWNYPEPVTISSVGTQPQVCDGSKKCEVHVAVDCIAGVCQVSIDHDPTHLAAGEPRPKVNIVWHLPEGYAFCPALGDGVFLKYADTDQFDEKYATDHDDGSPSANTDCKKNLHFHWRGINSVPQTRYAYRIVFHRLDGNRPLILDPWIFND